MIRKNTFYACSSNFFVLFFHSTHVQFTLFLVLKFCISEETQQNNFYACLSIFVSCTITLWKVFITEGILKFIYNYLKQQMYYKYCAKQKPNFLSSKKMKQHNNQTKSVGKKKQSYINIQHIQKINKTNQLFKHKKPSIKTYYQKSSQKKSHSQSKTHHYFPKHKNLLSHQKQTCIDNNNNYKGIHKQPIQKHPSIQTQVFLQLQQSYNNITYQFFCLFFWFSNFNRVIKHNKLQYQTSKTKLHYYWGYFFNLEQFKPMLQSRNCINFNPTTNENFLLVLGLGLQKFQSRTEIQLVQNFRPVLMLTISKIPPLDKILRRNEKISLKLISSLFLHKEYNINIKFTIKSLYLTLNKICLKAPRIRH
eukprot:TRINITY_DN2430_c0_g1_i7.p1 TRINITY_DN2430_c0_g1~~TRINITY_DN2430_c0_g1_i7.p1  ORF type:complete len:364 (+),score=-28.19 TRINITY_DN2430_c0_g1_i7:158-1249(+)